MTKSRTINDVLLFSVAFVIAAMVTWLALTHVRHAVLNKVVGNERAKLTYSNDSYANPVTATSKPTAQQDSTGGCGCPSCCAVNAVL